MNLVRLCSAAVLSLASISAPAAPSCTDRILRADGRQEDDQPGKLQIRKAISTNKLITGAILAFAAAAAAPLHAQTYKWVDENGVTNYSNTPPPGNVATTRLVPARVSVVESDPALAEAAAAVRARSERQAELAEAEWLQRQPLMAAAQASAAAPPPPAYAETVVFLPAARPAFLRRAAFQRHRARRFFMERNRLR
jgi:hypothetical protein